MGPGPGTNRRAISWSRRRAIRWAIRSSRTRASRSRSATSLRSWPICSAAPSSPSSAFATSAAAAALDDTVSAFPAGLDTQVGPGGAALSGGQRRRLSVAQGLLRGADVLLLDEPTEGLDTATAARVLAGVRDFDRTAALVIALHDRQSPSLPWTPSARVELAPAATNNTLALGA